MSATSCTTVRPLGRRHRLRRRGLGLQRTRGVAGPSSRPVLHLRRRDRAGAGVSAPAATSSTSSSALRTSAPTRASVRRLARCSATSWRRHRRRRPDLEDQIVRIPGRGSDADVGKHAGYDKLRVRTCARERFREITVAGKEGAVPGFAHRPISACTSRSAARHASGPLRGAASYSSMAAGPNRARVATWDGQVDGGVGCTQATTHLRPGLRRPSD